MNLSLIFLAGINALIEYLKEHVLTCLIPAFFIAGAMSALIPKDKIITYLGKDAKKYVAYPIAIVAGLLLAVCSCTVLPLFAGIKKNGAGLGPALAFLYTAPATNILAISLTGSVLGWDFALARIVLSVIFAIVIGIIISNMFKDEEKDSKKNQKMKNVVKVTAKKEDMDISFFKKYRLAIFLVLLISTLIVGTRIEVPLRYYIMAGQVALISLVSIKLFDKEENLLWLNETWMFFKKIFPLLLIGIFIAGVLSSVIPDNYLGTHLGKNTLSANFIAAVFGIFMYFPTLVEVPMAKMFLTLGMAKGPLLAYLLADPVISFSSILVIRKLLGNKRTIAYVLLIIGFTVVSGLIYGSFFR